MTILALFSRHTHSTELFFNLCGSSTIPNFTFRGVPGQLGATNAKGGHEAGPYAFTVDCQLSTGCLRAITDRRLKISEAKKQKGIANRKHALSAANASIILERTRSHKFLNRARSVQHERYAASFDSGCI